MSADTVALVVSAGAAVIGLVAGMFAIAYRMGVLNGTVTAFMAQSEVSRSELLKEFGKLEDRFERHLDLHHGGVSK